mmetsp:Transcript_65336/g.120398  ORF Transcript_65336/g.120398 Transcript_65336/m.120398 type:complete len:84 (-) Transcript_65336:269-520(-)
MFFAFSYMATSLSFLLPAFMLAVGALAVGGALPRREPEPAEERLGGADLLRSLCSTARLPAADRAVLDRECKLAWDPVAERGS